MKLYVIGSHITRGGIGIDIKINIRNEDISGEGVGSHFLGNSFTHSPSGLNPNILYLPEYPCFS